MFLSHVYQHLADLIYMNMAGDNFILLPDQMYHNVSINTFVDDVKHCDVTEYSDTDSNDNSDFSAEEYLKEMEKILRKIRLRGGKRRKVISAVGERFTSIFNILFVNLGIHKQYMSIFYYNQSGKLEKH